MISSQKHYRLLILRQTADDKVPDLHKVIAQLLGATKWPILVSAVIWLTVSPTQAEIYKWVDESGRIHYSEVPPMRGDSQAIVPQPSRPELIQPETNEKPLPKRIDQNDKKLNESAEKHRISAENKRIREKNCAAATQNLNKLKSSGRIKLREGDEYRFISPEEKGAKISQSKKQIEQYCD